MPMAFVEVREIATASGYAFGHATLQSTPTLNALSLSMIRDLARALDRWATDPRIAGVVLDGAGDKAFCAGGDVAAIARAIRESPGVVPALATEFFEEEYRLDYRIHTFPKALLCWGHGIVMGGGIGLLAGASHRVVVPGTRMAAPEVRIGLYPDVGCSWLFHRMPGRTGLFLALTGASINASDAKFVGLADFVIRMEDRAQILEALPQVAWSGELPTNERALTGLLERFTAGVDVPASQLQRHRDLIDATIGSGTLLDAARRLRALTSHGDSWLSAAATTFTKGSPTSAALSWELARRTERLSLADVFRLEYQVSIGCCAHPDFPEGVRALLIDKDRNPHWHPGALEAVTESYIADHFRPRYAGPNPLTDLVGTLAPVRAS
jgi:enoyl-CoA hydratase/carnithine racemase